MHRPRPPVKRGEIFLIDWGGYDYLVVVLGYFYNQKGRFIVRFRRLASEWGNKDDIEIDLYLLGRMRCVPRTDLPLYMHMKYKTELFYEIMRSGSGA